MKKTTILALALVLCILPLLTGCGDPDDREIISVGGVEFTREEYDEMVEAFGSPENWAGWLNGDTSASSASFGDYTVSENEGISISTVSLANEVFTMEVPSGWNYSTVGQGTNFGIYLFDPDHPERKIFYFAKLEWFNKSEAEKAYYGQLAAIAGGGTNGYTVNASLPVLPSGSTADFWNVWPAYLSVVYAVSGTSFVYPDISGLNILEVGPNQTYTTPGCTDNSILRAWFTTDSGTPCEGILAAQVTDQIDYYDPLSGIDLGQYCAYDVMGVTASREDFPALEEVLTRCLASFDFTDAYVRQTVQSVSAQTDAILAQGRELAAVYDSYNAAWSNRQTSYDIISQKDSDATLGYDRLYDPETNEVYRAEVGFYENYDLHRGEYANPNLQIIDSGTESYYLNGIDYYITK